MANETKNWVLVSTQIPRNFDVLAFHNSESDMHAPIVSDWEYRAYEVPEWGSFEGVRVTESDRFIAQVCGASLEALDDHPHDPAMIGDIRAWAGEYLIVAPNGDYVKVPVEDRFFRAVEPQQFGLEPYCTWDPEKDLGVDLTDTVFGE